MALICTVGPVVEPVTLSEAKEHLRVDIDDDDALITGLITAAREYIETICRPRLALTTQTWQYIADGWPGSDTLELRPYPLQSVASIKYVSDGGVEDIFGSANYVVDASSQPGRLRLKGTSTWPSAPLRELNGLTVEFVAGYGDDGSSVPTPLRQALLLLVGQWYENREPQIVTGAVPASLAFTVQALLAPWRREV